MFKITSQRKHRGLRSLAVALVLVTAAGPAATTSGSASRQPTVRTWTIHYRAHNGVDRQAVVLLPAWYGPKHNPSLPLVISAHGRNGTGKGNAEYWGNLPAVGRFAVVNPDGMGRRLAAKSYAYKGQIDDLAKMPDFATKALPWLRIDRERVYALGSSMGGQETLMLLARYPDLLAGAAAMDSVTDLALRYRQFPKPCRRPTPKQTRSGLALQGSMRKEVGGIPEQAPKAYAARSPLSFADAIASSGVPLQIWWSRADRIVTDQSTQSGALFRKLRTLHRNAPVTEYVGRWPHSNEMRANKLLPIALIRFGLLPRDYKSLPGSVSCQTAQA